jgi:hypothetical protein
MSDLKIGKSSNIAIFVVMVFLIHRKEWRIDLFIGRSRKYWNMSSKGEIWIYLIQPPLKSTCKISTWLPRGYINMQVLCIFELEIAIYLKMFLKEKPVETILDLWWTCDILIFEFGAWCCQSKKLESWRLSDRIKVLMTFGCQIA